MGIGDWWTPKPPNDGTELNKALEKMGFSFDRTVNANTGLSNIPELQRRWVEAKRHFREHRLWILTILSAAAAVLSAATALVVVLSVEAIKRGNGKQNSELATLDVGGSYVSKLTLQSSTCDSLGEQHVTDLGTSEDFVAHALGASELKMNSIGSPLEGRINSDGSFRVETSDGSVYTEGRFTRGGYSAVQHAYGLGCSQAIAISATKSGSENFVPGKLSE